MLKVRLTPRGSRDEVLGWDGDTLRIRVTAPSVEGAANKALTEFVAERLGVRRGQVSIVSGGKSREKVLRLADVADLDLKKTFGP